MSQKTNPISLRLQKSNKRFSSCWYSDYFYNQNLDYDFLIRSYVETLSEQIGHLQMSSFLQSHYKRAYIYLFFLDVRSIREEREKGLKILHKSGPFLRQKRNSFLPFSFTPLKERDGMSLEEGNASSAVRFLAFGFAHPLLTNSHFGARARETVEDREAVTRQTNQSTKQVQKVLPHLDLQANQTTNKGSASQANKAFLQMQRGSIYSLFSQNVLSTCLKGAYPIRTTSYKKRELPKTEQVCLPFHFALAQEQGFDGVFMHHIKDLKDSIKHKENEQNCLFCLFPKKDLKRLPLRLSSFGLLCALLNLKNSLRPASQPADNKVSMYKPMAKQTNKTHAPLGSAYAHQDLMEVSMSQARSHSFCERLVEGQHSISLLNSCSLTPSVGDQSLKHKLFVKRVWRKILIDSKAVGESNLLQSRYANQPSRSSQLPNNCSKDQVSRCLKNFEKSTIAVAARFPLLSLIQGLQIQNTRLQNGCTRHQFVSLYPIRVVKEAQNAIFVLNEIVLLLQKGVPFRKIRDQTVRDLTSSEMVKGVRFSCSGRVGGRSKKAQKTKTQSVQWGETGLHVFSSKLSFAKGSAATPFGKVGVKVWVCYK